MTVAKVVPGKLEREAVDHPIAELLAVPNSSVPMSLMVQLAIASMIMTGEAYLRLVRAGDDPGKDVIEIWPLHQGRIQPIASDDRVTAANTARIAESVLSAVDPTGWIDFYEHQPATGGREWIPYWDVVHAYHQPADTMPFRGHGPARALGMLLDLRRQMQKYWVQTIKNGCRLTGILETGTQRSEHRVASFAQAHAGPEAAGRVLHLEPGEKFTPTQMTPKEMDFLETWAKTSEDLVSAMGMLPARFATSAMTYNNLATAIGHEVKHGALPLMRNLADALALRLLTAEERRAGLRIVPDLTGFQELIQHRVDSMDAYARAVQSLYPPSEAAESLGLPLASFEGSDEAWAPDGLSPIAERGIYGENDDREDL
jgi:phage portal protein BeeE